jgi:hypothetical protein
MLTAPTDREELARLYSLSLDASLKEKALFNGLKTFCLFVGAGRSGASLIGSLLDAHPRMIVAHQLHPLTLLRSKFTKWQIYYLLLANSRQYAQNGRSESGYGFDVPGQWQGRFERLEVIGDKSAPATEVMVRADPSVLDRLAETVQLPVKVIHVMRNPYDNISTMSKRSGNDLATSTRNYFGRCETVATLARRLSGDELFHVRSEEVIENPASRLQGICEFLGVGASPEYLEACADIVFPAPRKSREDAPWEPDLVRTVAAEIEQYPFLQGYSFEQ